MGAMPLESDDDIDWEAVAVIEGAKAAAEMTVAAPTTAADGVKEPWPFNWLGVVAWFASNSPSAAAAPG